jgi:hypothetical protein
MTPKPRNATRRTGLPEEEFADSITCVSFQGRQTKLDYPSDAKRALDTTCAEREPIRINQRQSTFKINGMVWIYG